MIPGKKRKEKNKAKSKKYEHPCLCSRSRTPSTNLVYVMYAFPSDIGDICQSILVQNGQASHVREYVHRVSSNWSLHAPPVPFSIFVPNTYPILPFKRVITSFSEDRSPDHFRSTVLELIGWPESHLASTEQEKDITESRKSIALEGGRKRERERKIVLEKWAIDERDEVGWRMRLVACISSGSSDSIVRALPLLLGRLASRTSIRNEFYRYRQISPFKPSDQSFREIYTPRFIPSYIYILSSRLNGRHFFETSLGPAWIIDDRWEYLSFFRNSSLKFEGSFEARKGRERIVFSREVGNPLANRHGRSLEIFLHRGAQSRPGETLLNEPRPLPPTSRGKPRR